MPAISSLNGKKIFDSRGSETIEATLTLDNGTASSVSLPQAVSRGKNEAVYLSTEEALKNLKEIITPALCGMDIFEQEKIDKKLIELDGTANKSKLGANAILGASLASARASAKSANKELWQRFSEIYGAKPPRRPRLFINVIEGGLHSLGNLRFQEYLIIPQAESFAESMKVGQEMHVGLKEKLIELNGENGAILGDEGGYAADLEGDLKPFELIREVAKNLGLEDKIKFGLDAAASNIQDSPENLAASYQKMFSDFSLFYLEDPFGEEDFASFARLKKELPNVFITGDDLTATNLKKMEEAKFRDSVNGVIIKPNQIGTVTETLEAIKKAREWNWLVVVSHRGGETEDDFIADLAYGVGADGLKLGSPSRPERLAKYHRLLAIEKNK